MRRATWGSCVSGLCCGVRESSSQPLTPKGTAPLLHCPDPRKARATFHGACPRPPRMAMPVARYTDADTDAAAPDARVRRPGSARIRQPGGARFHPPRVPGPRTPAAGAHGPFRTDREATRVASAAPGTALAPFTLPGPLRNPSGARPEPGGTPAPDAVRRAVSGFPRDLPPDRLSDALSGRRGRTGVTAPPGSCAGRTTDFRTRDRLFSANFEVESIPCRNGRSTPLPAGRKRPSGTLPPHGDGP